MISLITTISEIINCYIINNRNMNNIKNIETFIYYMIKSYEIDESCLITMYIYLLRLIDKKNKKNIMLRNNNWREIITITMLLSSKYLEDDALWASNIIEIFPSYSLHKLYRYEKSFFNRLNHSIYISTDEFNKTLIELEIMKNDGIFLIC